MRQLRQLVFGVTVLLFSIQNIYSHTPPEGAKVFFVGIADGDVVTSPVHIGFGIKDFSITPAGTTGKIRHTAGHHHLLLDLPKLPDLETTIPRDEQRLHFDQGETDTRLELSPGKHTLQLLLGDEDHEPQNPALYSEKITITVK